MKIPMTILTKLKYLNKINNKIRIFSNNHKKL